MLSSSDPQACHAWRWRGFGSRRGRACCFQVVSSMDEERRQTTGKLTSEASTSMDNEAMDGRMRRKVNRVDPCF